MSRFTRLRRTAVITLTALIVAGGLGGFVATPASAGVTFVVNTDTDTDDGVCDTTHCSLREALTAANATTDEDRIEFTVAGPIAPTSALPSITEPVVIDGGTEPACAGVPGVVLDGTSAGASPALYLAGGDAVVRGLVLSNWADAGVFIVSSANVVQCTYSGTDVTGTVMARNQRGIQIISGGSNNLIGGTEPGQGNLLSGNLFQGLGISGGGANDNVVQGNLIGTDITGEGVIPNGNFGGIALGGNRNIVGGTEPGARNVISGNGQQGVSFPVGGSANVLEGNYIGVDISGNADLGNATDGVAVNGTGSTTPNHVIRGNVVSGNTQGLQVFGSGATGITIEDNLVGVGADGITALPNGTTLFPEGTGIIADSPGTTVRRNTIANQARAVVVGTSTSMTISGVSISENSILASSELGIDLAYDGVTPNDVGDVDAGPNGLQNFPVITAGSGSAADGTLGAASNTTYRIEVFASPECGPSGHGPGARFVGAGNTTTDAAGSAAFSIPVTGVADGDVLTATATAPNGSTSEFSTCEEAVVEGPVPVVLPRGGSVVEGNSGTTTLNVLVELSEPSTNTVTVGWNTIDTLAQPQAGVDYQSATGTLTFDPGETAKSVPITVYGDTLDENLLYGAEWGGLLFHSPVNATIGAGLGQLGLALIIDDDPPPTILPIGGVVLEGNAGTTTLLVRVDLSAPSGQTVSVDWATIDSLVQPQVGVDYQAASGTLSFAPGQTSKTIPITVFGDTVDEPGQLYGAEWGGVSLSNRTNATFGTGILARIGLALIADDD